ncbi:MAG: SPOR domain-containing protein [Pseudorhodobacter sp.]|nr:SPOR domain-containing protein [Pseudorhodobacter sp.]
MADVDFVNFEGSPGTSVAAARGRFLVRSAGALTSIALIVGLGLWGYRIAVRDVMGIPVVRALQGPMRVAPQVPGGDVAAHQGLAVNAVAATGGASPPAERLVLAPRPVDLAADDAPGLAASAPVMVEAGVAAAAAVAELMLVSAAQRDAGETPALAIPPTTEGGSGAEPAATPLGLDLELAAVSSAPGGMTRSKRPLARPAALPVVAGGSAAAVVPEIDATTLAVGTRLVQLGAFDDADGARAEWDKLAQQFGDLLAGKSRVVQAAQSGGIAFYRLRAHGFADEDEARRFCSALLAENAACIPVAVR